ncbi:MAG: hypothetical protein IKB75_06945 [Clostridia bacterium]|nr:hypothetical protein [Clostridia bacterium]MBR2722490.1 hypothetical protein [Clostridia bacterium]
MKVSVNSRTVFRFPTCLIVNRFFAGRIRRELNKSGLHLTKKQTLLLMGELKKYKKRAPDWNLVEVTASNGDRIVVKI